MVGDNPLVEPYVILRKDLIADDGSCSTCSCWALLAFYTPQIMRWDQQHLEGQVRMCAIWWQAAEYIMCRKMRAPGRRFSLSLFPHQGLRLYDTYPEFC